MSDNSSIEWTQATWNPTTGCMKVSSGCDHCYAETFAERWRGIPGHHFEQGFDVVLRPDKLDLPLRWRKPRRIFVNSMSDLFHDKVPDEYIARVFAVMACARQHTFQLLTKRHGRMRSLLNSDEFFDSLEATVAAMPERPMGFAWPLSNVWLGVSVEDQKWADIRIPALLATPAAVRWISAEPLLGPIDLGGLLVGPCGSAGGSCGNNSCRTGLDWVVTGGESGPGARPMHPDWARGLRDACTSASVPFFFKQWGEWGPAPWRLDRGPDESVEAYKARAEALCATHAYAVWADRYGHEPYQPPHRPWSSERVELSGGDHAPMRRWGKKAAGRLLDGRTWDEYPEPSREVSGV